MAGVQGRAAAQTLTEGSLQGSVRVAEGAPVNGVIVTLRDRLTGALRNVPVNGSGLFRLLEVRPGEYDLTAEAFGLRPQRVEGILVRAGSSTFVETVLTRSEDPNASIEVRAFTGAGNARSQQFQAFELERFPQAGRELGTVARLSTLSNSALETEGLPGTLSGIRVDGLAVGSSARNGGPPSVLPLSAFRQAEFLNVSADVEWSGTAAPALAVQTASAGPRTQFRGFGAWLSGPAQTGGLNSPVFNGVQAGALLSGPLIQDTASFVAGMEFWRLESPLAFSRSADSAISRVALVARDVYGLDAGAAPDRLAQFNAVSAFGRLEWRLGEVHSVRTSGAFTTLPRALTVPASLDRLGAQSEMQGSDGFVSSVLASNFSESFGQEFRVGWDRTERDYGAKARAAFRESSTSFVEDDVSFGQDPAQIGRFATSTFRLRETLHMRGIAHHVKMGISADVAAHDFTYSANRTTSFWFSSAADFASGAGYGVARNGLAAASFRIPRYGAFLQDEWSLGSRIRVLAGARWDLDALPLDDVRGNGTWLRLTGMRPDSGRSRHGRFSPRLELEWQPGTNWGLRASGGVWDAPADPALFGQALADSGRVTVQRGFGTFQDWPQAEVSTGRPSLSLLAGAFQGPRSTRAALQLSRSLAPGVELVVGGTYRRTELLPRRTDLNLMVTPVATDQYGREVFGTLEQRGGVLAAASGSNRRFTAFDVVSAIGVDGWSEYRGVEATLQARVSNALELRARYTYSQTEDNWFMARDGGGLAELSPFRTQGAVDWTEGPSDFDVPHRAMLGAEVSLPALRGVRLAALYRYRSGYPFTPGFPAGVDANGDGSLRNDPAFVDAQSDGFSSIAAAWPCLQEQAGGFAARNSCRAESASLLDARVSFGLMSSAGASAELVIDGLNLIAAGAEEVDHALYRVNPQQSLTSSSASSQVFVPLVINPRFGAPLLRASAFRTLRVGLRVSY